MWVKGFKLALRDRLSLKIKKNLIKTEACVSLQLTVSLIDLTSSDLGQHFEFQLCKNNWALIFSFNNPHKLQLFFQISRRRQKNFKMHIIGKVQILQTKNFQKKKRRVKSVEELRITKSMFDNTYVFLASFSFFFFQFFRN